MKSIFLYILIVISASTCQTRTKATSKKDSDTSSSISVILNKKNYRFMNEQYFDISKINHLLKDGEVQLNILNEEQKQLSTDKLKPLEGFIPNYNAYFYSIQNKIDDILPVVIYTSSGEYSSLYLLTFGDSGELIDYLRLTRYNCDVIDQDDRKEVVGCISEMSSIDDGDINIIKVKSREFNYTDSIIYEIDSINLYYKIINTGKIKKVKQDSVHYKK
jgi:hypothetical protein